MLTVPLIVPPAAAMTVRATFEKALCRSFGLRHATDRNTRRYARQSVHHFIALIRQLP